MTGGRVLPEAPREEPPGGARTRPLAHDTVAEIAACLGVEFRALGGSIPGREAWQAFVAGPDGRPAVALTVWPRQRRVDAVASAVTAVLTEVVLVRVGPGEEVTFARADGGEMAVRRGGRVVVRC